MQQKLSCMAEFHVDAITYSKDHRLVRCVIRCSPLQAFLKIDHIACNTRSDGDINYD